MGVHGAQGGTGGCKGPTQWGWQHPSVSEQRQVAGAEAARSVCGGVEALWGLDISLQQWEASRGLR